MKYRKLRIAWSVAWGVVAVLLCVLWVRSYWWDDVHRIPNADIVATVRSGIVALVGIVAHPYRSRLAERDWLANASGPAELKFPSDSHCEFGHVTQTPYGFVPQNRQMHCSGVAFRIGSDCLSWRLHSLGSLAR